MSEMPSIVNWAPIMDIRVLGRGGLRVSALGLGCMGMSQSYGVPDDGESLRTVDRALELGVTFFDTADVYSVGLSEEITGAHLREMASRDDIVVATKVQGVMGPGPNKRGLSRKHIIEACENSLRRLQMDYVDLYQIHRLDPLPAIEETLEALD